MSSWARIVSILNNDDNPSFAVRSAPRFSRDHPASPFHPHQQEQPSLPVTQLRYSGPHASSESPVVLSRNSRHSLDTVTEAAQPSPPGSSDGSTYDYFTSQPSSVYLPYARGDSRGPAPARTPPETRPGASALEGSPSQGSNRGSTGRKNKYPCPYAASHGCMGTFTTSGHAARHGKKHTGEKSVRCPICNKAFTRKDNMKQHIRTHRSHSDDMRSVSEPETDSSCTANRADASSYASPSYHHRTVTQSAETQAAFPSSGSGQQPPP